MAPGVTGHAPHQPPRRAGTFSSLFGKKEKSPEVETKEVFIPKYELDWDRLKEYLDKRFAKYNCAFTKQFNVAQDKYVVYLPEDLTEDDEIEIAKLKTPRTTT